MTHDVQGLNSPRLYYQTILRTLTFITHEDRILLLKGSPHKRLWANLYNGIGGHVEAGETILEAAQREVREETGLSQLHHWLLKGIVTIQTEQSRPGIILFVFTVDSPTSEIQASDEGTPAWLHLQMLPSDELVEDLPMLLPHIFNPSNTPFFAHYNYDNDNHLNIRFTENNP